MVVAALNEQSVAVVAGDDTADADGVPRRLISHRGTSPSELICLVKAVL
jgi:hypothetical protein